MHKPCKQDHTKSRIKHQRCGIADSVPTTRDTTKNTLSHPHPHTTRKCHQPTSPSAQRHTNANTNTLTHVPQACGLRKQILYTPHTNNYPNHSHLPTQQSYYRTNCKQRTSHQPLTHATPRHTLSLGRPGSSIHRDSVSPPSLRAISDAQAMQARSHKIKGLSISGVA